MPILIIKEKTNKLLSTLKMEYHITAQLYLLQPNSHLYLLNDINLDGVIFEVQKYPPIKSYFSINNKVQASDLHLLN